MIFDSYLHSIWKNLFLENISSSKIALIYNDEKISYKQASQAVLGIMQQLLSYQSRQEKLVVAIAMHKSPIFLYAILACAFLGVIWVPIDIQSPKTRMHYLLTNSDANLVLIDENIEPIDGFTCILAQIYDEKADLSVFSKIFEEKTLKVSRNPAYYLYTSGSTGLPKCVVLNHYATANVLQQTIEKWGLSQDDVFIAITPFHHDMSVFDIFASMALGATLVLPTQSQSKDAVAWTRLVNDYQATVWVSVPAMVDMLLMVAQPKQLQSLRIVAQGGDYINIKSINELRKAIADIRLFSLGGPTETTIWSIWYEITDFHKDSIPYGEPLKNNQYYILNEQMQPCRPNEIGTMYVSGTNLSNGYLSNGILCQNSFVSLCIDNKEFLAFKTSDKGYFKQDGLIMFSGRESGYLKIKGTRISASEVELAVNKLADVQQSVAVACHNTKIFCTELIVFYTTTNQQPLNLSKKHIMDFLRQYLPETHLPTKFIFQKSMPLSSNGKVDKAQIQNLADKLF
ncbi:AMP-binding protein [Moraxella marmotae]|uniref:AMP-binding protein n=1 Tax=Moraxella marmotae TaxID=3344520 RepID=UPI0035F2C9A7